MADMTELEASVRPGSPRFEISWDRKNKRLKVSLCEEAEQGRANAELVDGLSKALGAPVEIIRGHKGRRKLLRIMMGGDVLKTRLASICGEL